MARYATASSTVPLTEESYTLDALGRRLTIQDALGNVTSNTYDWVGRIVRVTYPDGSYSRTVYDLPGNILMQIGPVTNAAQEAGATTTNRYDILDRLVTVAALAGRTNSFEYDPDYPAQVRYVRDTNGEIVQENRYDDYTGWLLTNITHRVTTVYEYNALGQRTKTTFADSSWESSTYDGPRMARETSRSGNSASYAFDAVGRTIAVTNSRGNVTRWAYDPAGNLTNTVDALGHETGYCMTRWTGRSASRCRIPA